MEWLQCISDIVLSDANPSEHYIIGIISYNFPHNIDSYPHSMCDCASPMVTEHRLSNKTGKRSEYHLVPCLMGVPISFDKGFEKLVFASDMEMTPVERCELRLPQRGNELFYQYNWAHCQRVKYFAILSHFVHTRNLSYWNLRFWGLFIIFFSHPLLSSFYKFYDVLIVWCFSICNTGGMKWHDSRDIY